MMLDIISGLDMSCCCMRLMSIPPPIPPIISANGLGPAPGDAPPPPPAPGIPKGFAAPAAAGAAAAGAGGGFRACERTR